MSASPAKFYLREVRTRVAVSSLLSLVLSPAHTVGAQHFKLNGWLLSSGARSIFNPITFPPGEQHPFLTFQPGHLEEKEEGGPIQTPQTPAPLTAPSHLSQGWPAKSQRRSCSFTFFMRVFMATASLYRAESGHKQTPHQHKHCKNINEQYIEFRTAVGSLPLKQTMQRNLKDNGFISPFPSPLPFPLTQMSIPISKAAATRWLCLYAAETWVDSMVTAGRKHLSLCGTEHPKAVPLCTGNPTEFPILCRQVEGRGKSTLAQKKKPIKEKVFWSS